MIKEIKRIHHFALAAAVGLTAGLSAADSDASMQGVRLEGLTWDHASEMPVSPQYAAATEAFENFCNNNNREDMERLYTDLEVQVMSKLNEAGAGAVEAFMPNEQQIDNMLDEVEKECDRDDDDENFGLTTIIYSECRMTMDGMTGQLDIKIPFGGGDGHMIVFDGTEGMMMNLTQRVQDVSAQVGQGWSKDLEWYAGPGEQMQVGEYTAYTAQFEYSVGMGAGYGSAMAASQSAAEGGVSTEEYLQAQQGLGQNQALQMLGGMVSNKVTGWGAFSTEPPGMDIIQTFYRNFAERVSPSGETSSFMGGMIMSSVALLEKGIPLRLHTTLETKLMGKTMISGESESRIYEVELVDLPSDWCTRSFIDESQVTDIDAQLQQALSGGAGSGAGNPSGASPAAAPGGMTPEQSAQMQQGMEALEGMGLGSMMQQMMGAGANPAGQAGQAAQAPAGQTQAPAGAAPAAASTGSLPSSDSLMTDDMTQSVQNHLQALGYDPGNTDGSISTETVIAISQFQAEKGMEVTGEVSPQLLGILGAEVDSR